MICITPSIAVVEAMNLGFRIKNSNYGARDWVLDWTIGTWRTVKFFLSALQYILLRGKINRIEASQCSAKALKFC